MNPVYTVYAMAQMPHLFSALRRRALPGAHDTLSHISANIPHMFTRICFYIQQDMTPTIICVPPFKCRHNTENGCEWNFVNHICGYVSM